MKIDVEFVEYLGSGEAVVELNTGSQVVIFWNPSGSNTLLPEDVTGVLGGWLEQDTSEIPNEAMQLLQQAYAICTKLMHDDMQKRGRSRYSGQN